MFDYTESVNSDFFYSAMMLNSDMNYRTLNDLTEHNAIFDYRGLHNLDLLNEIAKGNFDLKSDTVHKVKKLIVINNKFKFKFLKYINIDSNIIIVDININN